MPNSDQNSTESKYFHYNTDSYGSVYVVADEVTVEEQSDHVKGRGEGVGEGETQTDD